MQVTVKLFAQLVRYRPGTRAGDRFVVELRDGATIHDLIQELAIPKQEVKVAFVNGLIKSDEQVLQPGDEVGIFSPIGGG